MATWDREKRILYHERSVFEQCDLRDVPEPNLLRGVFPYEEIPRIDFDQKLIPINPPKSMFITDTTFRDGQQARPPFTPDQIETIYKMLHRLGGPEGIIRQCEFFVYSDKDREAVERCRALDYRFPEVTAWVRANRNDLKILRDLGINETGMLMSVSDYHIFLKLKKTRRKAFDDYLTAVKAALNHGLNPRCHFEDVTRADIYGFCVPLAKELMKLREESGIDIKIRLCDTLGFGVTYPGAALPRAVDKLVRAMIDDAGVPGRLLEWHGHNDFHKGLINATTAWMYGCAAANGAVMGLGERTGNTPVEALIVEYISLTGKLNGIDTRLITEIAEYMQKEVGVKVPRELSVHRSGIQHDVRWGPRGRHLEKPGDLQHLQHDEISPSTPRSHHQRQIRDRGRRPLDQHTPGSVRVSAGRQAPPRRREDPKGHHEAIRRGANDGRRT